MHINEIFVSLQYNPRGSHNRPTPFLNAKENEHMNHSTTQFQNSPRPVQRDSGANFNSPFNDSLLFHQSSQFNSTPQMRGSPHFNDVVVGKLFFIYID